MDIAELHCIMQQVILQHCIAYCSNGYCNIALHTAASDIAALHCILQQVILQHCIANCSKCYSSIASHTAASDIADCIAYCSKWASIGDKFIVDDFALTVGEAFFKDQSDFFIQKCDDNCAKKLRNIFLTEILTTHFQREQLHGEGRVSGGKSAGDISCHCTIFIANA